MTTFPITSHSVYWMVTTKCKQQLLWKVAPTCNTAPLGILFWGLKFVSWLCRTTPEPSHIYWELNGETKKTHLNVCEVEFGETNIIQWQSVTVAVQTVLNAHFLWIQMVDGHSGVLSVFLWQSAPVSGPPYGYPATKSIKYKCFPGATYFIWTEIHIE